MLVTDSQFNVAQEKTENKLSSLWNKFLYVWAHGVQRDFSELEEHSEPGENFPA